MQKPTESQLAILAILWRRGPSPVRVVNELLNEQGGKSVRYTGTLKLMQLMHQEGLLSRDESSRTHVYSPAVEESVVQQSVLKRMADTLFRGSATNLVLQALGSSDTTAEDLEAIKRMIEAKEKERES
ncbi:MAG: BlaI/MecI/CopY family transcriptional regulator [Bacteroidota bacterium]